MKKMCVTEVLYSFKVFPIGGVKIFQYRLNFHP